MLTLFIKPRTVNFTTDPSKALDFETRGDAYAARWWIERLTMTPVGVFEVVENDLGGFFLACVDASTPDGTRHYLKENALGDLPSVHLRPLAKRAPSDVVGPPATLLIDGNR